MQDFLTRLLQELDDSLPGDRSLNTVLPKRVVIALCKAVKEAGGGNLPQFLEMLVTMVPKRYDPDLGPDDLVTVSVETLGRLVNPLLRGQLDIDVNAIPSVDGVTRSLLRWYEMTLPLAGNTRARVDFYFSLIDKIRRTVSKPTDLVAMCMDFIPGKFPPNAPGTQVVKVDVELVKPLVKALIDE